jgi:hypothetical protein
MPELPPAVVHVAQNQAAFQADSDIYGDFLETLFRIQALYGPFNRA